MRVLFLETIFSGANIRGEPLAILQLSSALKNHGHVTELADLHCKNAIRRKIKGFNPDIVAFSARTGFHLRKFEINRELKKENKKLFSVFGGSHVTFFPSCINEQGVDAICIGDGEEAFVELCDLMDKKSDITKIKNIWVQSNGRIFKNDVRPPLNDLDSLPLLDRKLLYQFKLKRSIPIKTTITSRGCPFSCSYCYSEAIRNIYKNIGTFLRRQSPVRAIEEIENIKKYGNLKYLIFEDDIFTLNKEWLMTFSGLYKKYVKIPFWVYTHVQHIDREVALLLKEANCHMVGLGIESADYTVRKEILNRGMDNSEIEAACQSLKRAGIRVCTGNILGIPGSSIEHDIDTLRLNVKIGPEFATASMIYPFPGTRIAKIIKEKGYRGATFDDFISMRSPKSVVEVEWQRQAERLQLLFLVMVKCPFLLRYVNLLLILPLNKIYYCFAKICKIFTFGWILTLKLNAEEIVTFFRIGFYYMIRDEV